MPGVTLTRIERGAGDPSLFWTGEIAVPFVLHDNNSATIATRMPHMLCGVGEPVMTAGPVVVRSPPVDLRSQVTLVGLTPVGRVGLEPTTQGL